ncbi:MAG: transposase [Pseudomonadota bacterium]
MQTSKFPDPQKAFIEKHAEDGVPTGHVCCRAGIIQATFYSWRKRYAEKPRPSMGTLDSTNWSLQISNKVRVGYRYPMPYGYSLRWRIQSALRLYEV